MSSGFGFINDFRDDNEYVLKKILFVMARTVQINLRSDIGKYRVGTGRLSNVAH
jgi:hypothetical protein